jgi:hypothetical protein
LSFLVGFICGHSGWPDRLILLTEGHGKHEP